MATPCNLWSNCSNRPKIDKKVGFMPTKFDLDTDFVRKLAKLLEETGLSEIEYAEGDKKIRCAITPSGVVQTTVIPAATAIAESAPAAMLGTPVPAPMVGTVYLASAPGAAP